MDDSGYAIRFLPEAGGSTIALDVYTKTLGELVEGLDSLRLTLSPILAERVKWPTADVRDYLRPAVLPTERGSLLVPIALGVGHPEKSMGLLGDGPRIGRTFWRYSGQILKGAAAQRSGIADIPASCAEHFSRASRGARENGRAGLQMVQRNGHQRPYQEWRPIVDLTRLEDGLAKYAERRNAPRMVQTMLIGRIRGIFWNPPQIQLELPSGQHRMLSMTAGHRDEVRKLWGQEVAVEVDARMTLDGEIRDTPKMRSLKPMVHIDDPSKDLAESFGSGRDVWDTKEAEDYLKGLRGRDS
jgi:hypothetical protein